MEKEFYKFIYQQQKETETVPPNEQIASWVIDLICLLFPEKSDTNVSSPEEVEIKFTELKAELVELLNATSGCNGSGNTDKTDHFFNSIPELYRILNTDIEALLAGDPAARTRFEIIRAYPGFYVISYSGATILGGETIIGHNSIIGGNVWLTKSIPSCSTVYHRPDIEVVEQIKS